MPAIQRLAVPISAASAGRCGSASDFGWALGGPVGTRAAPWCRATQATLGPENLPRISCLKQASAAKVVFSEGMTWNSSLPH